MELAIRIQIEELPEGLFLATSDQLPGLVAQGRTVAETLELARDVARKLIEPVESATARPTYRQFPDGETTRSSWPLEPRRVCQRGQKPQVLMHPGSHSLYDHSKPRGRYAGRAPFDVGR